MKIKNKYAKYTLFLMIQFQDPRTKDWFLIGSPWSVLTLLGFYLYFVQVLGPRLMERREPYKIERIIQMYNVLQILLNAYLLRVVNNFFFVFFHIELDKHTLL